MTELIYQTIGFVRCSQKYRFESPKQSILANNSGTIELQPHCNFEQGLEDLEGFDYIWVIYDFHLNKNWKPKVNPPRNNGSKKGVFATRSPHRPNSIGMSCVRLLGVKNRTLTIDNFDMLDETPVLDIKPYLSYADSIPMAKTGWIPMEEQEEFQISFADLAKKQMLFIQNSMDLDLRKFSELQLKYEPLNTLKKRVSIHAENYQLACRTWKIHFKIQKQNINIFKITSSYSKEELKTAKDKYKDKKFHHEFLVYFSDNN